MTSLIIRSQKAIALALRLAITITFYPIADDSEYCFLKGTCRSPEKINDTLHKLWICLAKRNGNIVSTQCSFMTGLPQTCNHVIAALFRIEGEGYSCTSKPCNWLPSNRAVKPIKIKYLKLNSST